MQIAEGIIQRLETQCKEVRDKSLEFLERVSESLYLHVKDKDNQVRRGLISVIATTDERLDRLLSDADEYKAKCKNLKSVAEELIAHKKTIVALR